jgi:hypothetical protein
VVRPMFEHSAIGKAWLKNHCSISVRDVPFPKNEHDPESHFLREVSLNDFFDDGFLTVPWASLHCVPYLIYCVKRPQS